MMQNPIKSSPFYILDDEVYKKLRIYILMLTYSILFTHNFINLFTHLSSKYPELSNVICQMPYFKGSKKGVFSPFFDPIFALKPLYVVVETYYSLSKPQYVIRIAASTWVEPLGLMSWADFLNLTFT